MSNDEKNAGKPLQRGKDADAAPRTPAPSAPIPANEDDELPARPRHPLEGRYLRGFLGSGN